MAKTYNVYASNSQELGYIKIAEGITEPTINIQSPDPVSGGEKFVKVAEVNDAGEGFLSKPVKLTFIGEVPKPEILFRFNGGFFTQYWRAPYANASTLMLSIGGGEFMDADTSLLSDKGAMVYNDAQNLSFKTQCSAENSKRTGAILTAGINQNFNIKAYSSGINAFSVYRSGDSGVNWNSVSSQSGNCFSYCYLDNNIILLSGTGIELRSTDSGFTWESKGFRGDVLSYCYLGSNVVIRYGITYEGYPNNAYSSCWIERSVDNGLNWGRIKTFPRGQHKISSTGSNFVYLGRGIVLLANSFGYNYMSFDSGISWNQPILAGKSVNSLCYIGQNRLWAGLNGEGLWYSENGGYDWSRPFPYLNSVNCICYQREDSILVGTANQGLWGISSAGKNYAQYLPDNIGIGHIVHAGGFIYLAATSRGLEKSIDDGRNWKNISNYGGILL